ncbi:hypothetical protein GCM10009714_19080 [Microlunatus capsulatus]
MVLAAPGAEQGQALQAEQVGERVLVGHGSTLARPAVRPDHVSHALPEKIV